MHHHFGNGLFNPQLFFQHVLIRGGQLGHSDQQRAGTIRTGQARQSGGHHGAGAGGMDVHQVHIQRGQSGHSLFHGVGDIMQLQIQEDLVAPGPDLPDDGGAFGVEQFHADLHKGLFLCEAVQKCQCLFLAVKVQRNDNVFTHDVLLL